MQHPLDEKAKMLYDYVNHYAIQIEREFDGTKPRKILTVSYDSPAGLGKYLDKEFGRNHHG